MSELLNEKVSKKIVNILKKEYVNDDTHSIIHNTWRDSKVMFKIKRLRPVYYTNGSLKEIVLSLHVTACELPGYKHYIKEDGTEGYGLCNSLINSSSRSTKIKVNRRIRYESYKILKLSKFFDIQHRVRVKTITWEI